MGGTGQERFEITTEGIREEEMAVWKEFTDSKGNLQTDWAENVS